MEEIQHLKISLDEILLATNNFSNENSIGRGAFGKVYVATLVICGHERTVAIKRLDDTSKQGQQEFLAEVQILSCCRHKNIVSLLGFCNDGGEKILVYEYAVHGSLDKYLNGSELHWMRRLEISIGAARGLKYLHNDVGPQHRVLHRDIKSSNILLNEDWEAKISDFGLSKIGPSNVEFTFLVTNACGTLGYVDPQYYKTGILTKESDVYSFGVVLFEILCGTLAQKKNQDDGPLLSSLAQSYYEQNRLAEIIHPDLKTQVKAESLKMFSKVAYQCLEDDKTERPTMAWVVDKLEKALEIQDDRNVAGCMRIGTWGGKSNWSFKLERGHRLLKLTIDHGERIYSVAFTSEYCGVLHNSTKFGSFASGDTVSEVMFDVNEEITSINGTTSTQNGSTFISSLSFQTTKRAHGPFGQSTKNDFSVPWDKGSLMGFYGVSGDYIESIGVYLKAYEETIRVGTWGRIVDKPDNFSWSFNLNKNHRLKKIIVDHGDILYSLMFTSEYRRSLYSSNKVGGWNGGGDHLTEVIFDLDEEIHGINGTVGVSKGIVPPCPIISSISFVTNKRTYGPFGEATGTFFNVEWEDASFAGFYGFGGWYIDSIGVYFKSTT